MSRLHGLTTLLRSLRYFSAISRQLPKDEIANQINPLFTRALENFRHVNGVYPGKIFFYR